MKTKRLCNYTGVISSEARNLLDSQVQSQIVAKISPRSSRRNDKGCAVTRLFGFFLGMTILFLVACSGSSDNPTSAPTSLSESATTFPTATFPPLEPTFAARIAELRSPDVPDLPFADNPDPNLCGIPTPWNDDKPAWLSGYYEGELIEPIVHLYDSHMRLNITTEAPHGTQVKVLLYQSNPHLDYYLVKIEGAELPNEGWIPSPFLSFEEVATEVDS